MCKKPRNFCFCFHSDLYQSSADVPNKSELTATSWIKHKQSCHKGSQWRVVEKKGRAACSKPSFLINNIIKFRWWTLKKHKTVFASHLLATDLNVVSPMRQTLIISAINALTDRTCQIIVSVLVQQLRSEGGSSLKPVNWMPRVWVLWQLTKWVMRIHVRRWACGEMCCIHQNCLLYQWSVCLRAQQDSCLWGLIF